MSAQPPPLYPSRRQLAALFEAAPMAVIATERDGRVALVNARAAELFGYAQEQLLGRPVELLMPAAAAARHVTQRDDYWTEPRTRPMGAGRELAARHRDGREFPVEIGLNHIDTAEGPLVLSFVTDLTARKAAEEAQARERLLGALLEAAPVAVIAVDYRGLIVLVNAHAERLFGFGREELLGRPIEGLLPESARTRHVGLREHYQDSPASRPMGTRRDLTARHRDGHEFPVEIGLNTVETPQGPVVLSFVIDISARKQAESALQAQKQWFESLVTVARATASGLALDVTLQNALEVASNLTGADYGSIILIDEGAGATASVLGKGRVVQRNRSVQDVLAKGLAGWIARYGQSVLIPDTLEDERWVKLPDEPYAVRSVLGVPIWSGAQVRGVLTLQHREPQHFTQEHLELIQAAAAQMALALANAQSYEAQRRAAEQRRRMYEVLRALGGWFGVDALVRAAVQAISRYASWVSVDIALLDEQHPDLWAVRGATSVAEQPRGRLHSVDEGIIGRALRTGRVQWVPDVHADPDYVTGHSNTRCELAVPLLRGERVLGALNLESERVDGFSPDEIALAESLAEVVVLALDNARLYQAIADERGRLQALIDASRDGVLLIGADHAVQVVNAAALVLLGLPGEREGWLGRPVEDLFATLREQAPAAFEAIQAELARLFDTGVEHDVTGGAYDLETLSVRWVALPVQAQNVSIGQLLVLHNMTQERQVERLREDLTHTMVHDLRNPLSAMISSVDLFGSGVPGPLNQVQGEIIDIMRLSVQRMLELVNAILDVSRLESGAMPVERHAVDLAAVSAEVLHLQQTLAGARRIRLAAEFAAGLPAVHVDPTLTARILQNLIGNAIKFGPEGSTVWIKAEPDGEGAVRVSVRDEGKGIPPELQGRLFQRFVTGTQRGRGSGLGLAFCRLAVEAQGGRIWVESSPGGGATFFFTLPAVNPDARDGLSAP